MRKEVFVPYTLQSIGIYAYPELVTLFTDFFENRMTKEQATEIEKHLKATRSRNKLSKAFDEYQVLYKAQKL